MRELNAADPNRAKLKYQRRLAKVGREKLREEGRLHARKDPKKRLIKFRKWKYGVSPEQIEAILVQQSGLCAICKTAQATHLDHNHSNRAVRGMLCHTCNAGLGMLSDSVILLKRAIEYLKRYE